MWVDRFITTTTEWPREEERQEANQAADHDLPTLGAVPLLLAQCDTHAVGERLKGQRQRVPRLVVEEATCALPNLHNDALVTFQRLRQRVALIPDVKQVLR
jgi:hypothetical protein